MGVQLGDISGIHIFVPPDSLPQFTASQNAEKMLRRVAKQGFIPKAARHGDGRTSLTSTSGEVRAGDGYGMKRQGGLWRGER